MGLHTKPIVLMVWKKMIQTSVMLNKDVKASKFSCNHFFIHFSFLSPFFLWSSLLFTFFFIFFFFISYSFVPTTYLFIIHSLPFFFKLKIQDELGLYIQRQCEYIDFPGVKWFRFFFKDHTMVFFLFLILVNFFNSK